MTRTTWDGKKATESKDGYFSVLPGRFLVCTTCWCLVPLDCRKDHRKVCTEPWHPTSNPYDLSRRRGTA